MKLVVIYGPPAVGKLAVGMHLARKTGFRLLHSHQLAEAILPVFPYGAREFYPLMERMRMEFISAAAKNGKIPGVILTGVYSPKANIDLSDRLVGKLRRIRGIRISIVRLACRERELYRRMKQPSRKAYRKPRDRNILKHLLGKYRVDSAMRARTDLTIDNTRLSPAKCALAIKSHFSL